ncbi:MAG: hypothetical protein AAF408_00455 [Pseudomonadota bacterium]
MRWGLLFCDMSARLIGLFGLYCTVLLLVSWQLSTANSGSSPYLPAALAAFSMLLAASFLWPKLHDGILRRSMPFPGRVMFIAASMSWLFIIIAVFDGSVDGGMDLLPRGWGSASFPFVVAAILALFALTIFPVGLAYRETRETVARQPKPQPVYSPPKSRIYSTDKDRSPGRRRDLWDLLADVPLIIMLGLALYSYRFGNIAVTGAYETWLAQNWYAVAGAISICGVGPILVRWMAREPLKYHLRLSKPKRRFGVVLFVSAMSVFSVHMVSSYGLPWAWTLATPNAQATLQYRITGVESDGLNRGCTTMQPVQGTDRTTHVCAPIAGMDASLKPGDVVNVTGELSRFAHRLSTVSTVLAQRPSRDVDFARYFGGSL